MYSKKSKYSEYAKYQKYKSKYLELQKSISQFGGGILFRIKIDQNIKNFIYDRQDLQILKNMFIKPNTLYDIESDNAVAIKLLELCKENPSWEIKEGAKRIPNDKLVWQPATYTLSSPGQVLVPVPIPEQLIRDLPDGFGFVEKFRLKALADTKVSNEHYLDLRLDLRTMPLQPTADKFIIDSHYTLTTCMGKQINTVFDTGNSADTACSLKKVRELGLKIMHKIVSKNSIIMYNLLVDAYGRGHLVKIRELTPPQALQPRVQREQGIQGLREVANRFLEDQDAIEYQETNLEEFIKLLDRLLPYYIDRILGGANMNENEKRVYLYETCGVSVATGVVPGAYDIYLYETYLPIEASVVNANGIPQPNFKFLVKADVGEPSVDLLISDEDIRKLSLNGATIGSVQKSHQKRDRLKELRKKLKSIRLLINIKTRILHEDRGFGVAYDLAADALITLRRQEHEAIQELERLLKNDIPITQLN
jgi:hypothetical protein